MYRVAERDLIRLLVVDQSDQVDIESWWSVPVYEVMTAAERESVEKLVHEMALMMRPVLLRMMMRLDD